MKDRLRQVVGWFAARPKKAIGLFGVCLTLVLLSIGRENAAGASALIQALVHLCDDQVDGAASNPPDSFAI